jgi:uncharacterized protein YbaR (Trm112 family)
MFSPREGIRVGGYEIFRRGKHINLFYLLKPDKMKRQMMSIICCPVCKIDLALKVKSENDAEILTGFLTCGKCKFDYPIEDGIPNLLPPDMQKTM